MASTPWVSSARWMAATSMDAGSNAGTSMMSKPASFVLATAYSHLAASQLPAHTRAWTPNLFMR